MLKALMETKEKRPIYYDKIIFCDFVDESLNVPKEMYLLIFSFYF